MAAKQMFIMRGLPGSGKSTKTGELVKQFGQDNVRVCSADVYFIRPDGQYDWNPKFLRSAHFWCYKKAKDACEINQPVVIIDNTNIKREDLQPYADLGKQHGYVVTEVVVGQFDEESCKIYAERNQHGCPLDVILKRAKVYEP